VARLRRGFTLFELLVVAAILAFVAGISVPRASRLLDRLGVRGGTHDVLLALAIARSAATHRGDYAAFLADPASGEIRVVCGQDTLFHRNTALGRRVTLSVTRDSITYAPTGLGWGAANTTIVISRGGAADTIVVSRMGRVRH